MPRRSHAGFAHGRIRFEREVLEQQRHFKMGLLKTLRDAKLRNVVTAPVIYAVFNPLVLLDLFGAELRESPAWRNVPITAKRWLGMSQEIGNDWTKSAN
jgi:hypothetical protein